MVCDWVGGQRLIVHRGMAGATGNIYVGLHEFADMMLAIHFLREGDLFLDIGANVGAYTVLSSGVCGATTWAFEPDPLATARLRDNVELNDLDKLVTIHQAALGAESGLVSFTLGCDTTNRVILESMRTDVSKQQVAQWRLDDVIGSARPIMAKIDVEGYEEQVIRGAMEVLSLKDLKVLEIETLTPWIEAALHDAGFERVHYDPLSRTLGSSPVGCPANNALFVRDRAFVVDRIASAKRIDVLGRSL